MIGGRILCGGRQWPGSRSAATGRKDNNYYVFFKVDVLATAGLWHTLTAGIVGYALQDRTRDVWPMFGAFFVSRRGVADDRLSDRIG